MWPERDSSHVGEPRVIWGPRLLSVQHRCSAELVGLAFVAAIQAELVDSATSSEKTNQRPPRLLKPANQQKPRHCTRFQEKSTHKIKGPSIFTISSPSCSNSSSPLFSTSCFLCKRPLPSNKDIYMYRGDQAFCTKQCRYHQMVVDESKEKIRLRTPAHTPAKCHIDYYKHNERSFACV